MSPSSVSRQEVQNQRGVSRSRNILLVTNTMRSKVIIIITRPKPVYGRQVLVGSRGQDTDQAGTFWGVLNVSLRAFGAQLGYKPIWNYEKP